MPGMMDTILDLGLNDATTDGLHARRATSLRGGVSRPFEQRLPVDRRPSTMCPTTVGPAPAAIEAVFGSWNGDAARATARRRASPTTRDGASRSRRWSSAIAAGRRGRAWSSRAIRRPASRALYGDVLFDAQGEDVVAGARDEPIAVLDERLPGVGGASRVRGPPRAPLRDLCDIEFTIEDGRLWLLQVRVGKRSPQAALRMAVDMAEDPAFPLRGEAVERVRPLLLDPPRTAIARATVDGCRSCAGSRPHPVSPRADRHDPRRAVRSADPGAARGDPRPRGDLADASTGWPRRPGS
jgi:pyruvate,orthophosphate dikinase